MHAAAGVTSIVRGVGEHVSAMIPPYVTSGPKIDFEQQPQGRSVPNFSYSIHVDASEERYSAAAVTFERL